MARATRNSLFLLKTPAGRDLVPTSVAGNGPWPYPNGVQGIGLPRPMGVFDGGAFGPMPPSQVYPLDPTTGQYSLPDPRVAEYMPGYNLPTIPGYPDKLVPFKVLRDLSKFVMPLRAALDIKKLEVSTQEWDIRLREDEKGIKSTKDGQDGQGEARTAVHAEMKAFLQKPDPWNGRTFSTWVKLVVEEINVVDALSIWLRPTKGKKGGVLGSGLTSLDILQGDLIKPLRDIRGSKPLPPAPAYQQYLYGAPRTEFTFPFTDDALAEEEFQAGKLDNSVVERFSTNELIYRPFNERTESMYGFSAVEKLLPICQLWLRRQGWHLSWFDDGDVPGMIAMLPKEWTGEAIRNFQVQWNREIAGDPQWKHRVKFMPGGQTPPIMTKPPVYDMTFDEWIIRLIALGCDVAPEEMGLAPKHGGLGGGGWAEQAAQRQVRLGTLPFLTFAKEILDWVIAEVLKHPEFEFVWLNIYQQDQQVQSQVDGTYVDKGIKTRYQVAQEHGWPTDDNEAEMKELTITTASGVTKLGDALKPPEPPMPPMGFQGPGQHPPGAGQEPRSGPNGGPGGNQPPGGGTRPQGPGNAGAPEAKKAALAEINQWERWYAKRGATAGRSFTPKVLDAEFAESIQQVLDRRPELADAVFMVARETLDADLVKTGTEDGSEGEAQAIPFTGKYSAEASPIAAGIALKARDTGRVLMLQRAIEDGDRAGGKWEFPGGNLEADEEPIDGARREWEEELGIALPQDAKLTGSWTSPNGVYAGYLYEVEHESDVSINAWSEERDVVNPDDPDGDQIETVAWWDPAHIQTNIAVRDEVRGSTDWSIVKVLTKFNDQHDEQGRFATGAGGASQRINDAATRGDLKEVSRLMGDARNRGLDIHVGTPNDHADMREKETLDKAYPRAGATVDGMHVRDDVPNMGSIEASFSGDDYEVLSGVREVSMSYFESPGEKTERTRELAAAIGASKEINPLIVAVDKQGPYILEGGHRFDALRINGAKSFPAIVVIEEDGLKAVPTRFTGKLAEPDDVKVAFFTDEDGVVHPIRGSDGYEDQPPGGEGRTKGDGDKKEPESKPREKPPVFSPPIAPEKNNLDDHEERLSKAAAMEKLLGPNSLVTLGTPDKVTGKYVTMNRELAGTIHQDLVGFKKDFPQAVAQLKGIHLESNPYLKSQGAMGWYRGGDVQTIGLGSHMYASPRAVDDVKNAMFRNVESGHLAQHSPEQHTSYIFNHEFGHHLDDTFAHHMQTVGLAARARGDEKRVAQAQRIWSRYQILRATMKPVSEYAKTNDNEKMAEGFAAGRLNPGRYPEGAKLVNVYKAAYKMKVI